MRKGICLLLALVLCAVLVSPAFAVDFVPSITYKPTPDVHNATLVIPRPADATVPEGDPVEETEQEHVGGCIVVTSIIQAEEKTTDIAQEDRDLLLDVYDQLVKGEMTLPMPEDYIVRELLDISWEELGCIQDGHPHEDELQKEGVVVKIHFDLDIKPEDELKIYAYHDGKWDEVQILELTEDGNAVCLFEHFCPVAFCVKNEKNTDPTGDLSAENLLLWIVMLSVSTAAVVVMSVNRRKFVR